MANENDEEVEPTCPGCGAVQSQWAGSSADYLVARSGFLGPNGDTYCCKDCAEGRACNCNPERLESLVKKRIA